MLTPQRHQLILTMLKQQGVVKVQELVDATQASESTVRRDLIELEKLKLLKRVHGGAALLQGKGSEPSIAEKFAKNLEEKKAIARHAATLVEDGDCIYLDAGSTVGELIPYLSGKQIVVVTNGLSHLDRMDATNIKCHILGGMVKASTKAVIGSMALDQLRHFRFDRCFLGVNGIHPEMGYTTPDPEEARLKRLARTLSGQTYVLADQSKFAEISFAQFAEIEEAVLVTSRIPEESRAAYENKTYVIEVGTP
ncbi:MULTISPECIES: DeoR/GlpR family DNA-binding transcription regulator [Thermoactinomyces]|uniref:DeoR/GlpR transcriptional regulator n=1 Tax=Thermoactinomyces daqus TaxID=1329516 RepID=A0A7W1XAU3_9BACL|nr:MULTISPECIES: DeoR/GlpR family DNA-binding transcription regulator [Thermoactinomyces]MBA4543302.1 DeoR/GlpR transcriptional regulator [Thermoactinomyces daqus]MBH8598443.1 DeoR/GlpR transcriptional regulator [Thermoactinomyces sp. CICC 10523]MBH8606827.1 DeoR/GlpR transcriptional regulator [Thermoactinomyces sp. CICC 10521]